VEENMVVKTSWVLVLGLWFCLVSVAEAHISLDQAGTHKSRYGDADDAIKSAPCGMAGGARGTNIYTYEAGSTIEVEVSEFVSHPGYFRIAFDDDGDDDFKAPASIPSEAPSGRPCVGAGDKCGEADYYNNEAVLPEMDNLDPHADGENNKLYKWQVKLPDKPCDNCTLQIIQVMTESFRAPYDPEAARSNDIYFTCIDLVLTPAAGAASGGDAGAGAGGPVGGAGGGGASPAGGPASSGSGGSLGTSSGAAIGAAGSAAGSGAAPSPKPPVTAPPVQAAAIAGMGAPAPMGSTVATPQAEASGCSIGASGGRSSVGAAFLLAGLSLAWRRRALSGRTRFPFRRRGEER
jgi:hypothetical protein